MEDQSKKKIPLVKWTVGISHFPELEGKGRAFFPTHNFDIIKHHREYVYKKFIVWEFANERVIKRVKTTEKDFKECRNNWLNSELNEIAHLINLPSMTRSDQIELKKYRDYVNCELNSEEENIQNTKAPEKIHLLSIPTKAVPEEIVNFWLRLQQNNEKGEPYWNSKLEIEHFVNQNFEGFPGVDEKKEFNPNMNKSELNQVTWTFFNNYGKSKTKKQYANLLEMNFTKFRDAKNVYSNIKDQSISHLKGLLK